MTPQEANNIIAEYMGSFIIEDAVYCFGGATRSKRLGTVYSSSLDALVPVCKKYCDHKWPKTFNTQNKLMLPQLMKDLFIGAHCLMYSEGLELEESVAISLAKLIQEIGK